MLLPCCEGIEKGTDKGNPDILLLRLPLYLCKVLNTFPTCIGDARGAYQTTLKAKQKKHVKRTKP